MINFSFNIVPSNVPFTFEVPLNSYFCVVEDVTNKVEINKGKGLILGDVVVEDIQYLLYVLNYYNNYLMDNNIGYDRFNQVPYNFTACEFEQDLPEGKYHSISNLLLYPNVQERFIKETGLRIYHFTNIPCKPFHVNVNSLTQAKIITNLLTYYDAWLYNVNLRNDYSSVTSLEYRTSDVFEEDVDKRYSWCEFSLDWCEELYDKLISFPDFVEYNNESDYISTDFNVLDLTFPILNFIDQYRKDSYFLYKPLLSLT